MGGRGEMKRKTKHLTSGIKSFSEEFSMLGEISSEAVIQIKLKAWL